MQQTY